MCAATSFFPFENGVPKCHKKHRKFICEHFAKVSNKIYCFIFFRTLSLTYILITRIIYALVKSYEVTNVKKYIRLMPIMPKVYNANFDLVAAFKFSGIYDFFICGTEKIVPDK